MKILKIVLASVLLICSVFCFAGCSREKTAPPTEEEVLNWFSVAIKKDMPYDKLTNFTFEPVATDEAELTELKKVFTSQVEYATYLCKGSITSIEMDANIQYRVTVAYNTEWKLIYSVAANEGEWEYKAKSQVSNKRIMNDLCNYKFGSFEKSYVGSERYSSIEITNRVFDESINRDTIDLKLSVKTDFGNVIIHPQIIYYFVRGEWVVGDLLIDDMSEWEIVFGEGYEIVEVADEFIVDKLTIKDEFLTYITNKNYMDNYTITKTYYDAVGSILNVHYDYVAEYDDIGSVVYDVTVNYEWLSYKWSEPVVSVKLKGYDFSSMVGSIFKCSDGRTLVLDEIKEPADELNDALSRDFYFTLSDGTNVEQVVGNFLVVMRDNNWDCVLTQAPESISDWITITLAVDSKSWVSNTSKRFVLVDETPDEENTSTPESDEPTEEYNLMD